MQVAGIIAEYNPFHTGHAYQIERTRALLGADTAVIAVMSGNWVQQGDCAVLDKWTRAGLALAGGVNLVLELPTVWALSSAEHFAMGAVSLLGSTGVADFLSFGSECGEIAPLGQLAKTLNTQQFAQSLREHLHQGICFPAARERALRAICGEQAALLSTANNNLGIEYLRALEQLGSKISPMTIKRCGAGHNVVAKLGGEVPQFLSATQIRQMLRGGQHIRALPYLGTQAMEPAKRENAIAHLQFAHRAILASLHKMSCEDWATLPDAGLGEGLPNRLYAAGQACASLDDFYARVKTKRYIHARVRRLALSAFLGITALDIPPAPPYLRVLGMDARGMELLRQMKTKASLPILTKPAHARKLDDVGRRLFELEGRCSDLYRLCFAEVGQLGQEWQTSPIIV